MATKKKVIKSKDFKKAALDNRIASEEIEWNGLKIEVKRVLTLNDVIDFVEGVAMSCFADDTGEYMPEAKDFAIRSKIIERYTNIELPPEDMEEQYDILYGSDIVQTVVANVDPGQLNNIISSIESKIEYLCDSNIEMVMAKLNEVVTSYENIEQSINKMFGGITNEDIENVARAISDGQFDEEKLVQSFLKQKKNEEEQTEDGKVVRLVKKEE